ncbi:uncharacterized protein LOC129046729 isoform X2 [Molothrus ater]|uniref:uncharacterized protein LOC129046729 isoform X2 n=1 Tax=Molothrus ater TaxID=84834 RepID=UPI0023E80E6A|nr:uncharacterized protein LOC129046729 isoform X2 [Molothrus ater]
MAEPGERRGRAGAPGALRRARSQEHPKVPPRPHGQQERLPWLLFRNGSGCWELWQEHLETSRKTFKQEVPKRIGASAQ